MMPSFNLPDPERAVADIEIAFFFHVFVGIDFLGDFSAVENIERNVDAFKWHEGGRNHANLLFPYEGPVDRGQLVLRWGMVSRTLLYDWCNAVTVGGLFRKEVYILQLTRDKTPLRLMRLAGAWPVSWKGAELDSTDNRFAVEEVSLVYDHMNLVVNPMVLIDRMLANAGEFQRSWTPNAEPPAIETPPYEEEPLPPPDAAAAWTEPEEEESYEPPPPFVRELPASTAVEPPPFARGAEEAP